MKEKTTEFLNQVFDHDGNIFIWLISGILIGIFIAISLISTTFKIKDYITLFGTFGGVFLGAWLAFKLNILRELKKEKQEHVSAGNMAIFTLFQMWEALSVYKSEELDTIKDQNDAWLNLKAIFTEHFPSAKINIDRLNFLLDSKFADMCIKLNYIQTRYNMFFLAHKARTEKLIDSVRPKIEKMELEGGDISKVNLIEKYLGKADSYELKDYYYIIVDSIEKDIPYIIETYEELKVAMQNLYPDIELMKIEFKLLKNA